MPSERWTETHQIAVLIIVTVITTLLVNPFVEDIRRFYGTVPSTLRNLRRSVRLGHLRQLEEHARSPRRLSELYASIVASVLLYCGGLCLLVLLLENHAIQTGYGPIAQPRSEMDHIQAGVLLAGTGLVLVLYLLAYTGFLLTLANKLFSKSEERAPLLRARLQPFSEDEERLLEPTPAKSPSEAR